MNSLYVCSNCGHESPYYYAECERCGREGTFSDATTRRGVLNSSQAVVAPQTAVAAPQHQTGEMRSCAKCEYETDQVLTKCPRCGRKGMQTASTIRVLGWVLLVIGAFLVVFMGALSVLIASIILNSGDPGATTRFNGGTKEIAFIVGVFSVVIAIGVTSLVSGFWQIRYGRRNKSIVRIMVWLALAFMVAGQLVYILD